MWSTEPGFLQGRLLPALGLILLACSPLRRPWTPPPAPGPTSGAFVPSQAAALHYATAIRRWLEGDRDAARGALEAALLLDPRDAWLKLTLGKLLLEAGEMEQGRIFLEAARVDDPALVEASLALGRLLLDLGAFAEAEPHFRASLAERETWEGWEGLVKSLARQKRVPEALVALQAWLILIPDDPELYFRRGALRYTLDDTTGALEDLGRFLEEAPASQALREYYLDFYLDVARAARKHRSALVQLDRLASYEPGNSALGLLVARFAEEHGDTVRALRAWERLDQLHAGRDATIAIHLSRALLVRGRSADALAAAQRAADVDPGLPGLRQAVAEASLKHGRPAEALKILQDEHPPLTEDETLLKAASQRALGRPKEAMSTLRGAWLRGGPSPALLREMARISLYLGDHGALDALMDEHPFKDALERSWVLLQVHRLEGVLPPILPLLVELEGRHPEVAWIPVERARRLIELGRAREAIGVLLEARARLQTRPDPALARALSYANLVAKDHAASLAAAREARALDPEEASIANDLAYILAEAAGDLDEARDLAREAVEREPGNPFFLDTLAWVEFKRGDAEEAALLLNEALTYDAEMIEPLLHLAAVLRAAGDPAGAREADRRAAQLRQREASIERHGERKSKDKGKGKP